MGELLVEIMRPKVGMELGCPAEFRGPYPSGAPGIFIDTVARLGRSAAIISGVGDDEFGACIPQRLARDGACTDFIEVFSGKSTGAAFVTYFRDGSRKFMFHWDGRPAVLARVPPSGAIRAPRYFHVMGCSLMANERFRKALFRAVDLFARKGAKISLTRTSVSNCLASARWGRSWNRSRQASCWRDSD